VIKRLENITAARAFSSNQCYCNNGSILGFHDRKLSTLLLTRLLCFPSQYGTYLCM